MNLLARKSNLMTLVCNNLCQPQYWGTMCSPSPVQYVPAWHWMHALLLIAPAISNPRPPTPLWKYPFPIHNGSSISTEKNIFYKPARAPVNRSKRFEYSIESSWRNYWDLLALHSEILSTRRTTTRKICQLIPPVTFCKRVITRKALFTAPRALSPCQKASSVIWVWQVGLDREGLNVLGTILIQQWNECLV